MNDLRKWADPRSAADALVGIKPLCLDEFE